LITSRHTQNADSDNQLSSPADIVVVGGLRFYRDSFINLLLLFVNYPPSSLNGTQLKPATCYEVSTIWKCMPEICGIPSLYKSKAQNHLFSTTSQLNGSYNGLYIFGMEHGIYTRATALTTARCLLYIFSKCVLVHKRLEIGPALLPTFQNSAFYYIARLRRRRSINETQLNFVIRRTVNRGNNLP